VIKEGTSEEIKIKRFLGIGTLEVVNRTTAKEINNLKFGGEKWEGKLKGSETWEVDFEGGIESFLEFTIVSEARAFPSKIRDKIVVPRGVLVRFEITNDKEVLVNIGASTLGEFTIQKVLDMAKFTINNQSSVDLLNVNFNGSNWGNINKDYWNSYIYYEPPINSTLTFQINTREGLVTLKRNITLNKGELFQLEVQDYTSFYRADVDKWVSINELI